MLEVLGLVVFSLLAIVAYHPYGYFIALPLLAAAVVLVPRERAIPATREEVRWQLLNRLQTEGSRLRGAHLRARSAPLTPERSQLVWHTEREIAQWMAQSQSQLKRFPEIGYIFKLCSPQATMLGELDGCLESLNRMRKLCRLSETLGLPI